MGYPKPTGLAFKVIICIVEVNKQQSRTAKSPTPTERNITKPEKE